MTDQNQDLAEKINEQTPEMKSAPFSMEFLNDKTPEQVFEELELARNLEITLEDWLSLDSKTQIDMLVEKGTFNLTVIVDETTEGTTDVTLQELASAEDPTPAPSSQEEGEPEAAVVTFPNSFRPLARSFAVSPEGVLYQIKDNDLRQVPLTEDTRELYLSFGLVEPLPADDIGENGTDVASTSETPQPTAPIAPVLKEFNLKEKEFQPLFADAQDQEQPDTSDKPVYVAGKAQMSGKLQERYDKLSPFGKSIIERLMTYVSKMRPGLPNTERAIISNQLDLFRAVHSCISLNPDEFRANFAAVLRVFDEYSEECFNPHYLYRGMANVPLNPNDLKQFPQLMDMLRRLGPFSGRKEALTQFRIEDVMKHSFKNEAVERVKEFFGV